jgi:hypothetical protein
MYPLHMASLLINGDIGWWQTPTFISSTIENNLATVCACAPTIRPLFLKLLGGLLHKARCWNTLIGQLYNIYLTVNVFSGFGATGLVLPDPEGVLCKISRPLTPLGPPIAT